MNNNDLEKFISVGDLSIGMSDNIIPLIDLFAGKTLYLYLEDGAVVNLEFIDNKALKYTKTGAEEQMEAICGYRANSPRKNIYFIDFIVSFGFTQSVSIILDAEQQISTIITGVLPSSKEMKVPMIERAEKNLPLSSVNVEFYHASVGTAFDSMTKKHEATEELIGKRIIFNYSSTGIYEHIYLSKHFYTWHCIKGNEEGLADTDLCFYYKIAPDLYCFVWKEKIIPTLGIVIEDFEADRSYGKLYGYEKYATGKVSNFFIGSFATFLNKTEYPL